MKVTKKLKFDIAPMYHGNIWGPLALFCRDAKDAHWKNEEIKYVADEICTLEKKEGYEKAFKKLSSYCIKEN